MSERPPVTRDVVIPAPREAVWEALTRIDRLSGWLGDVIELEARPGGSVIVREADGSTRRGLVEHVERGRELVFRWRRLAGIGSSLEVGEATRVALALEDAPAGTRVIVTEEPAPLVAGRTGP